MTLEFHPCSNVFNPVKGHNGLYMFIVVNDKGLSIGDWTIIPKPGKEYECYIALLPMILKDVKPK